MESKQLGELINHYSNVVDETYIKRIWEKEHKNAVHVKGQLNSLEKEFFRLVTIFEKSFPLNTIKLLWESNDLNSKNTQDCLETMLKESRQQSFSKFSKKTIVYDDTPIKSVSTISDSDSEEFKRQLKEAIQASAKQNERYATPAEMIRTKGKYVGLSNAGNTCALNSFLQSIFQIRSFLEVIFPFQSPKSKRLENQLLNKEENIKLRKKASITLVKSLQKLFAQMLCSNKSKITPIQVCDALADREGNPLLNGDQADVTELLWTFLDQVEEGLQLHSPRKSTKNQEDLSISKLFFGTTSENNAKTRRKKESFSFIPINIAHNTLYKSLKQYFKFSVQGYRPSESKEELIEVDKAVFIKDAPVIINFVLQRVRYDKERQEFNKSCDRFEFPEELNLQEFLDANRNQYKKLNKYEEEMMRIQQNADCIGEDLARNSTKLNELEALQIHLKQIGSSIDEKYWKTPKRDLLNYQERKLEKLKELEEAQAKIHTKIEKKSKQMIGLKYNLHSIVVHQGNAEGGHYFSYIFNRHDQKWRKFDDSRVTDVNSQEVFYRAFGNNVDKTGAYLLTYVQEGCEIIDLSSDYIQKLKEVIPNNILQHIEDENNCLERSLRDFNSDYMTEFWNDYKMRIQELKEKAKSYTQMISRKVQSQEVPILPSFHTFLLSNLKDINNQIVKWCVLKTMTIIGEIPYNILAGEANNYYYMELKNFLRDCHPDYKIKSLQLSYEENMILNEKEVEYLSMKRSYTNIAKSIDCVIDGKLEEALGLLLNNQKILGKFKRKEIIQIFSKFTRRLFKKILLKLSDQLKCSESDISKGLEKVETIVKYLLKTRSLAASYASFNEKIKTIIHQFYKAMKKKISKKDKKLLKNHLETLGKSSELSVSSENNEEINDSYNMQVSGIYETFSTEENSLQLKEKFIRCQKRLEVYEESDDFEDE